MKNRILDIIKENGLKTNFIIKKAGLAKSSFYDIANENSIPSLSNAIKISKALNKNLDEVFPECSFIKEERSN